ncbi:MAG: SUMF1/EgtB/PvdO family nonheme iron enzyme [Deltaproteobacteria bacterium]|nr:SUMF1/EgtB/PvdO family nonheme iron enzyme [Deltaproteobacteria bacterium]MCB9740989.1 SUMF1/EgtB/PvdO family nonheme iron enzyme [Deltaproteobacteria bacterium]
MQMQTLRLLALLLLITACGGEKPGTTANTGAADAVDAVNAADATADTSADSAGDTVSSDAATSDAGLDCPGGVGCPCSSNLDCDFPICVQAAAGRVCARPCVDACPDGESCVLYAPPGSDTVSVCAPTGGLLCLPCDDDAQCRTIGAEAATCVSHGANGGFCGLPCVADPDCPQGTVCADRITRAGAATRQCVPEKAACTCSPGAVAASAKTTCYLPDVKQAGRFCAGVRSCSSGGLTDCQPIEGAAACVDTQCLQDGSVGLPPLADDTACNDGVLCTTGDTCQGGRCSPGALDCECQKDADCPDDGNPCNGKPYCDTTSGKGSCKTKPGSPVECDTSADTACLYTLCDPTDGACKKVDAKLDAPCDDGQNCTVGDVCDGKGGCVSGIDVCSCTQDEDCLQDNDKCNGVQYCDKSAVPFTCKANPATVVVCETSADSVCAQTVCEPSTGQCGKVLGADNKLCDDGTDCTANDACKQGKCTPGQYVCQCKSDADCANKDDGDLCNGVLYCDLAKGGCVLNPATVVVCPTADDTACSKTVCAPKIGQCLQQNVNQGGACEDGQICTVGDTCQDGACLSGKPGGCACQSDVECAGKDDGNLCNGTLFCNKASGQCELDQASIVTCPSVDDTACLKNLCDPKSGTCSKKATAKGAPCDDGNACTVGDACALGDCKSGVNTCICKADSDCKDKEDGDACNGTLFCDVNLTNPVCKLNPATVVSCPSGQDTVCAINTCNSQSGACEMVPQPNGKACVDDGPCSVKSACVDGACKVLQSKQCDDGLVCTDDACDPKIGCVHTANKAKCPDDDPCTKDEVCNDKTCTVAPVVCDDGNICTLDACAKPIGCLHAAAANGSVCNDGSSCSLEETCQKGSCTVQKEVVCADDRVCTDDSCDPKTGACVWSPTAQQGKACEASGKGTCQGTACVYETADIAFVWVPGGKTAMSIFGQNYPLVEQVFLPPVVVQVSGFWIMRDEMSIALHDKCVVGVAPFDGVKKCFEPVHYNGIGSGSGETCKGAPGITANHPQACIGHNGALTACLHLLGPHGKVGQLATQAQFSRAARGGCEQYAGECITSARVYPWTDKPYDPAYDACQFAKCGSTSQPVGGGKDVSPYGVHDLAGNVVEISRDYYFGAWFYQLAQAATMAVDPVQKSYGPPYKAVGMGGDYTANKAGYMTGVYLRQIDMEPQPRNGIRCVWEGP